MQISEKPLYKLTDSLLFLFITLVFLLFFILTFKGFDGSDDMHYAMLASRVLHHRFDPFFADDIFTGRLGLIYWQAFLYRAGGINPVMSQSGTLICSVLCCYLVIFKLIRHRTPLKVVMAAGIFYFNPVLHASVTGIYPDAYVMLAAVLVMILLRSVEENGRSSLLAGLLAGFIIFLSSLFKEDGIILFVSLGVLVLLSRSKRQMIFFAAAAAAGLVLFSGYGLLLWAHSGNFFLRLAQIRSIQQIEQYYPQKCHSLLSAGELFVRLTYGPWKEAIRQGYFPLVIAFLILVSERIFRMTEPKTQQAKTVFLVLLFTIFYFPARMDQYQPVCPDMRHFLLLLPFGTVILTEKFSEAFQDRRRWLLLLSVTVFCLVCIVALSPNKWKWLTYGELVLLAALIGVAGPARKTPYAALFFILIAFPGLERLFFLKSDWYKDLKKVYRAHGSGYAYFPDHDNFMQWRLFGGFADTAVLNIEAVQVPPDVKYGPFAGRFRPGILVVNRVYSARSADFFKQTDALFKNGILSGKEENGDVTVYHLDNSAALDSMKLLMNREAER